MLKQPKKPKVYSERYVKGLRSSEVRGWERARELCDQLRTLRQELKEAQAKNDIYHAHLKYVLDKSFEFHREGSIWSSEWMLRNIVRIMHRAGRLEV